VGQELLLTLRGLAKRPAFTFAVLLLLVLGIGTNTAIWSLLTAIFLHPLPAVAAPGGLVAIYQTTLGRTASRRRFRERLLPELPRFPRSQPVFLRYRALPVAEDEPRGRRHAGAHRRHVRDRQLLRPPGRPPGAGPLLPAGGGAGTGGEAVAVLGHGCFSRLFGADPKVVGKSILLGGRKFTVVGVAPRGSVAPT